MLWTELYKDRLRDWYSLRTPATNITLEENLHSINNWWLHAPVLDYYLHLADYADWPTPWELLSEDALCDLAKCLGIVYTLYMMKIPEITKMTIIETMDGYHLVQLNNGEFILGVEFNSITDDELSIQAAHSIDCEYFKNKIK